MDKKNFKITGTIEESSNTEKSEKIDKTAQQETPTFAATMRVDNHTRNAVLALSKTLQNVDTANEVVAKMAENYLKSLEPYQLEMYQGYLNMLEMKDKMEYQAKKRGK